MKSDTAILVCDDSILARKSLSSMLSDFGYKNVYEVSNGEDCVNFCRENKPGVVLLDIVIRLFVCLD